MSLPCHSFIMFNCIHAPAHVTCACHFPVIRLSCLIAYILLHILHVYFYMLQLRDAVEEFCQMTFMMQLSGINHMFAHLARKQIQLNTNLTEYTTFERMAQIYYEVFQLNSIIRCSMKRIFDATIPEHHDMQNYSYEALLAVCTDTWDLICFLYEFKKDRKQLVDIFILAYDIHETQEEMANIF